MYPTVLSRGSKLGIIQVMTLPKDVCIVVMNSCGTYTPLTTTGSFPFQDACRLLTYM